MGMNTPPLLTGATAVFEAQAANSLRCGAPEVAVSLFSQGLLVSPGDARLLCGRSAALLAAGNAEAALADAERCAERHPGWGKGHVRAAMALRHMGRYAEALLVLDRALAADPDNTELATLVTGTASDQLFDSAMKRVVNVSPRTQRHRSIETQTSWEGALDLLPLPQVSVSSDAGDEESETASVLSEDFFRDVTRQRELRQRQQHELRKLSSSLKVSGVASLASQAIEGEQQRSKPTRAQRRAAIDQLLTDLRKERDDSSTLSSSSSSPGSPRPLQQPLSSVYIRSGSKIA